MKRVTCAALDSWLDSGHYGAISVTGVRGCGKTRMIRDRLDSRGVDYAYLDYEADGLTGALSGGPRKLGRMVEDLCDGTPEDFDVVVIDGIRGSARMRESADALAGLSEDVGVIAVGDVRGGFGDGIPGIEMFPLSFDEYLWAMGTTREDAGGDGELGRLFFEFMAVGGFPSAVSEWRESGSEREVDRALRELTARVRDDALRELGRGGEAVIDGIMGSIPAQLSHRNKKFMYSRAVDGSRSKGLARPIDALERVGAVLRVPIATDRGAAGFKLFCSDTGMLRVLAGLPMASMSRPREGDELLKGAAENAVLTELVKSGFRDIGCWRSGNRAEAELVVDGTVPIQIDLSDSCYARSLREYIGRHPGSRGVYMSPSPSDGEGGIVGIPMHDAGMLGERLGIVTQSKYDGVTTLPHGQED